MRTYLMEKRIIQISLIVTFIVLIIGIVDVWRGDSGQSGVNDQSAGPNQSNIAANQPVKLKNSKIVCIGDSYTAGYPGTADAAWPQRLADELDVEVLNAAKTGLTTAGLLQQFEQDVTSQNPGRVIIFAGNADSVKGVGNQTFQANIKEIVGKAREKGIVPIVVLPLPIAGTEETIAGFRAWEEAYAKDNNIKILDFQQVLAGQDGKMKAEYIDSRDSRYPNAEAHKAMGDYAAEMLK